MANNTLIKMKTGPISTLQEKENEKPVIPLEEGSVYFAVDTTNHIGQIVYDAPDGQNGVDRIVMSTRAETADHALTATSAGTADAVMGGNVLDKPSDFTPSSHMHGNIANDGTMSSNGLTGTNEDFLLFSDTSNGGKIERTIIPLATTSLVGMVQLSSVSSTTEETLAATPKGVGEAINTLDVITEDNTNTNKVWGTDDQGVPGGISSATMQVQKITLSAGNLSADSNNTTYPYKYEFTWTGVQEDDWVDGSGVSEMGGAVESKTNKIILHFAKPLSASTTINVYGAACDVIASSSPPQAPQYNITYNANGGYFGTNTSTTTNTVTYNFIQSGTNYEAIVVSGQVLTPNAMDGYAFDGGYMDDRTYTTPLDLTEIPASNDITVYAKYEDAEDLNTPGED